VFLLVGLQAMRSDTAVESTPAVPTTTTRPAPPKPDVRVYTVVGDPDGAVRVGDLLREAGWNVTEAGVPLELPVGVTTVYFGPAEGEEAAAASVGAVLAAPVEPRFPEIAEQPPGVIVLVTG
jgi:hypothetical protein